MSALLPHGAANTYEVWEEAVCQQIEARGLTRSDAQGCIEAKPFVMAQAWAEGLHAQATASRVMGDINIPSPFPNSP